MQLLSVGGFSFFQKFFLVGLHFAVVCTVLQVPIYAMQDDLYDDAPSSGAAASSSASEGLSKISPEKMQEYKAKADEIKSNMGRYKQQGLDALKRCQEGILKQLHNPVEREKLLNPELYRKKEQLKFNRQELCRFPPHAEDYEFKIIIQNQDIFKSGLLLLELGIEWQLYKKIQEVFSRLVCAGILEQREALLGTLEAFGASLECGDEKVVTQLYKSVGSVCRKAHEIKIKNLFGEELFPAFVMYVIYAQLIESLKRHYLWDYDFRYDIGKLLLADVIAGSQKEDANTVESFFDFFRKQINISTPLALYIGGFKDTISTLLYRFDILPSWTDSVSFFVCRQVAFAFLFSYWSIYSFFYPLLTKRVFLEREALTKILKSYDPQKPLAERKKYEEELYKFIECEYKNVFPSWLAVKNEKYSSWRMWLNVAVMMPSIISVSHKICVAAKPLFANKSAREEAVDV